MERWVEEALQEGIRFFVTSLGKPDWVVKMAHPMGGKVYHDVTERRWAEKGVQAGVDGLTAVNGRSGGHAGIHTAESLLNQVRDFGLPVVCAGGIGKEADFVRALDLGYDGVQMGTRFLATPECQSSPSYKKALLEAGEEDIVLTERLTGIPVAVLRTPYIEAMGTRVGPLSRFLLRWSPTKKWMRRRYMLRSLRRLGHPIGEESPPEYWQAGRSVAGIDEILPAAEILRRFTLAALQHQAADGGSNT
jgi:nitronate monooxygenase